jgi:predicted small lipoprotein YifL
MNDQAKKNLPVIKLANLRLPGIVILAGLFFIAVSVSACGNRGALYLKSTDEKPSRPGHEISQDSEKKDKRK